MSAESSSTHRRPLGSKVTSSGQWGRVSWWLGVSRSSEPVSRLSIWTVAALQTQQHKTHSPLPVTPRYQLLPVTVYSPLPVAPRYQLLPVTSLIIHSRWVQTTWSRNTFRLFSLKQFCDCVTSPQILRDGCSTYSLPAEGTIRDSESRSVY